MLSDSHFVFAGYGISSFGLLLAGALLLCAAAFLLVVARRNRVTVQRSVVTDEIAILLGRIADAVERLADKPGANAVVSMAGAEPGQAQSKLTERSHTIPYSIFGREQ